MINIRIIENGRIRPISTVYNYSSDQSEEILFDHFPILIQINSPNFHNMPLKVIILVEVSLYDRI